MNGRLPGAGRGAVTDVASRFDTLVREPDAPPEGRATEVHEETAKSIISRNTSPDVPFDRSLNPYAGCEHGCVYCYAVQPPEIAKRRYREHDPDDPFLIRPAGSQRRTG